MSRVRIIAATVVGAVALLGPVALSAGAGAQEAASSLVTVGSPSNFFPQNKQNEPGLAVDAAHPNVLAAGANEEIDEAACGRSDESTATRPCPFATGIGNSGVYFSFDSGHTWRQPTYNGLTERGCAPSGPTLTGDCHPTMGPIGTLPFFAEAGLVSDGDPALAFGPKPDGRGGFTYAQGSRLYYATLTANIGTKRDETFKGFEAIAVSRADNVTEATYQNQGIWKPPVIVSKQNSALFSDKEAVWADNAASSAYFGRAYVCNIAFRSQQANGPAPILFYRSTDGGDTWSSPVSLSPAVNGDSGNGGNAQAGGRQGCTMRTDSKGVVYVFWEGLLRRQAVHYLARSFDGGVHFERPRAVADVIDVGLLDPESGDYTFDGVAGARTDSFPSVDIANGAPTGLRAPGQPATDTILLGWSDGPTVVGGATEKALVKWSNDQGQTFNGPTVASLPGERPNFTAVAISPDGRHAYVTYMNFTTGWQLTTAAPRTYNGVLRETAVTSGTPPPGPWASRVQGAAGDARSSSSNRLTDEFLGDYNYAVATNTYGAAVWNDSRRGADCPAIDAYRQTLVDRARTSSTAAPPDKPYPPVACGSDAATFGNSDIYAATTAR